MTELILPQSIPPAGIEWTLNDFTGVSQSPLSGAVRTLSRGQRWSVVVRYAGLSKADRAAMLSFIAACRGKANRVWLTDPSNPSRGVFPDSELLTNPDFSNGTTAWLLQSPYTAAARKGLYHAVKGAGGAAAMFAYQTIAYSANLPYMTRGIVRGGSGADETSVSAFGNTSLATGIPFPAGGGMATVATVPTATGNAGFYDGSGGNSYGRYYDISYASVQQIALVDNGPNLLIFSNTGANAAWTTNNASAGDNGTNGPNGAADAEYLLETTANASHSISQTVTGQPAAATDFQCSFTVVSVLRTWCVVQLQENTGSTKALAFVNLATGAVGTITTGGNWANTRVYVRDQGGGWFRITVVARKTNAATSISAMLLAATANGTSSYTGSTASAAVLWWHASLAQSSVPVRDTLTTTVNSSGTFPVGLGIYLKGLPISVNGLLQAGDMFEINGELKRATSDLNSDAAGLGYVAFEPALRSAVTPDNSPVVFGAPMGKFLLAADVAQPTVPGMFTDLELTFLEAS